MSPQLLPAGRIGRINTIEFPPGGIQQGGLLSIDVLPAVIVMEPSDASKMKQVKQQYACGAGVAEVNLYTGRTRFEFSDMSVGASNFAINVSHVYNSHVGGHIVPGRTSTAGTGYLVSSMAGSQIKSPATAPNAVVPLDKI